MMARAIEILLAFTLIFNIGWACEKGHAYELAARQGHDELLNENSYPINSWVSPYYYNVQPRMPFTGYANSYEGRIPLDRKPASGYFTKINPYDGIQESRLAFGTLFNTALLSNLLTPASTWRPFANLVNRMEACTSPSGDAGHCTSASACSSLSGRPSGSCTLGRVCCVNVLTKCGSTVTLNNTYWQSPMTPVAVPSTCALTVKLDSKLAEQAANPICQIRLDFVSFTTQQPTAGTCTDTFQIGGASTVAPTICGDNSGQHMYLDVPSSATTPTDVQLIFNFVAGTATRSWNIKIAMLPCGASYLAPSECLQYFTTTTGQVKSFNWKDVAATDVRQLNNQKYNICFRTNLVPGSKATQMCVSPCTVTTGNSFILTGTGGTTASITSVTASSDACTYDFLIIPGGQNQATPFSVADRYCGASFPASVCTSTRPFKMTYGTDGSEPKVGVTIGGTDNPVPTAATPITFLADILNTGFCLDYQEK